MDPNSLAGGVLPAQRKIVLRHCSLFQTLTVGRQVFRNRIAAIPESLLASQLAPPFHGLQHGDFVGIFQIRAHGMPTPMRVTRTPSGFSNFDR